MDQGRLAGREDDAAQLPSVPIERGVALAECDRLQSGQPVATASVAEEDWELVADELAAAAGEDGRSACETCALLLAFAGRRHLSRRLFGSMLRMIAALPLPDG